MSPARAGLSIILIKRYRYFFLVAIILLILQAIISFTLLNSNSNFESKSRNSNIKKYIFLNGFKETTPSKMACQVNNKDMASALRRVRTPECDALLRDVYCQHLNGTLFSARLTGRRCPLRTQRGVYLGCHRDFAKRRLLGGKSFLDAAHNNVDTCIDSCLQLGYLYSGTEYGKECWCGSDKPTQKPLSDSECNMNCVSTTSSSSDTRKCGGFFTISVYSTGLQTKQSVLNHQHVRLQAESAVNNSAPSSSASSSSAPFVRIVFALTVNGRSFRQFCRLLKAIYDPRHYYFVHVDSRQDYLHRMISSLVKRMINVRMSINRFSSIWGGASLLQMHLGCLEELLSISEWEWHFFINLSESDMPIRSIDWLTTYMTKHRYSNFVKSHGSKADSFIRKQGLDFLFVECENRMWRIDKRLLPKGIWVDGGSDWLGLNREFAEYVVHSEDDLVTGLKAYWKYSLLASESFFHTVLVNSEFCGSVLNNNLHLTNWRRAQGCKCQYKKIVDWCGCSPNDFMPDDIARIQALSRSKRPIFFARKFEAIVNNEIINKLVDHLDDSDNGQDDPAYSSYWQNEYHHEDVDTDVSETFITHYTGLTRMAVTSISNVCQSVDPVDPVLHEVTVYNHEDVFRGLVLTYSSPSDLDIQLESLVKPIAHFEIIANVGVVNRLVHLQVGTGYDLKEELFRNKGNFICADDTPTLRHEWSRGIAGKTVVSVHNPSGDSVTTLILSVPKSERHVDHANLKLESPLDAGTWSIKMFVNDTEVARTSFLVLPITGPDHSGSTGIIDDLLSRHWLVEQTCYTDRSGDYPEGDGDTGCYAGTFRDCVDIVWSTRFPDPKSRFLVAEVKGGQ